MRVQTLSTETAVERFDERIVGRLARTNSLVTECDYAAAAFCFASAATASLRLIVAKQSAGRAVPR